jgi:hypothetical protein
LVTKVLNRVRLWRGRRQIATVLGGFDALKLKLEAGVSQVREATQRAREDQDAARRAWEQQDLLYKRDITALSNESTRAATVLQRLTKFIEV